jgi:4-aminobutyrate aminotransferase-like enzyme
LAEFACFAPFPSTPDELAAATEVMRRFFQRRSIGAVLVEPVQGRGGIHVPTPDFLPRLRRLCDQHGAVLIADEIYTGFGRTGRWFACEHWHSIPDIICLGKALTGGFPLSACVGRADLMDAAWPASQGEAIHTSTYLGHPVGCAMALAQIEEIHRRRLVVASQKTGAWLLSVLRGLMPPQNLCLEVRGLGLMAGVELRHRNGKPATNTVLQTVTRLLHQGFILLPEGEHSQIISFTPPLTIQRAELSAVVAALQDLLHHHSCL